MHRAGAGAGSGRGGGCWGAGVLPLVLPKGSLERATLELFDATETVRRASERDYHASVDDPRIASPWDKVK